MTWAMANPMNVDFKRRISLLLLCFPRKLLIWVADWVPVVIFQALDVLLTLSWTSLIWIKKIAKLRQSCNSFCVHNLQQTTFVCICTLDNFWLHYCNQQKLFLCTTAIVNFCLHYCNCQCFMEFTIANDNWSVKCFNWLLNAPLHLTTFSMHFCN